MSPDPEAEDRGDLWTNFYIPRDERYTMVKSEKLQEDAIQTASRKLLPAIQALYSRQTEFESVREIADLFKKGVSLTVPSDSDIDLDSDRTTPECEIILTYPTPKVIAGERVIPYLTISLMKIQYFSSNITIHFLRIFSNVGSTKYGHDASYCVVDETAWTMDEEFAREMLAGLNPVVIERLREFPIKSKLDEDTYGDPVSAITAEHIEPFLEDMDVRTALEGHKLFVLDYHDAFLPFVSKINENPACKAYATRTFLFLTHEGILRPVAIEVSLPQESEPGTVKRIFTPPPMGMKDWMWELAKVHVLANDAGYHQLSSHW